MRITPPVPGYAHDHAEWQAALLGLYATLVKIEFRVFCSFPFPIWGHPVVFIFLLQDGSPQKRLEAASSAPRKGDSKGHL